MNVSIVGHFQQDEKGATVCGAACFPDRASAAEEAKLAKPMLK